MNITDMWTKAQLKDIILNMQPGFAQRPDSSNANIVQLRTNNVSPEGRLDLSTVKYVKANSEDIKKYSVIKGDVIFNNTNSWEWVGKTAYFGLEEPCVLSNHMTRIRVNPTLIDPEFLAYHLHYLWQKRLSLRWAKQWVNQAAIDQASLSKFQITLPPLPEQRRIVAIVREADELRRLRRHANEKTQDLLPAIFYEMFQSPTEWKKTISLEKLVRFVGGGTPNRKIQRYFQGNIPWVTSKDMGSRYLNDTQEHITEEAIKNSATNLVPTGTILIVVKSKILVRLLPIGITTRPVCFGQDIKGLICKPDVKPQFIAAALSAQARHILNQARGVNTEGLNLEILRKIQIPDVDPSKQEEFTQRVIEYDQIEQSSFNFAQKSESLFQSLLAQAFTGELTATWREQHQEELVAAVAERDRLLQISQPVDVEELANEEVSETKRAELHHHRKELLDYLSQNQGKIYELVIQETVYFTPEYLEEKYSIPRNIGQKSLQLLAATGLIIPVTLPTPTSSGLRYELAYRNLNEDDDTQSIDVPLLTKDAV